MDRPPFRSGGLKTAAIPVHQEAYAQDRVVTFADDDTYPNEPATSQISGPPQLRDASVLLLWVKRCPKNPPRPPAVVRPGHASRFRACLARESVHRTGRIVPYAASDSSPTDPPPRSVDLVLVSTDGRSPSSARPELNGDEARERRGGDQATLLAVHC